MLAETGALSKAEFYYYYHTERPRYPGRRRGPVDVSRIDWSQELPRWNAVVLEINEAGIDPAAPTHYSAFLEDALRHLE